MANQQLFGNAQSRAPEPDVRNRAGAPAYAMSPRQALLQLAMTGCMNATFYAEAQSQLDQMLALCFEVGGPYVAQVAVHARRRGYMKDAPAVLCAWLASFDGDSLERVFDRVIDDGKMLRNFVQILRSGVVARSSLGSRPKRLVARWLAQASDEQLIAAMVGQSPSLADVIRMVHPKAPCAEREALLGYIIGREVAHERLPEAIQAFERFKADARAPVPDVPFQLLTGMALTPGHWTAIACTMSWTATRMNLNTLARHGVFEDAAMVRRIAKRLADAALVRKARAFPYQLLAADAAAARVPAAIRDALAVALQHATANVPALRGSVAVAVDVSGSMQSPVTVYRHGANSVVRCVDVAALMAACVREGNRNALVLPFNDRVVRWDAADAGVFATAKDLARLLGGGTNVSAALAELRRREQAPDLVIIISDNQSWIDERASGATETLRQWRALKSRNRRARLVCIDLQPYTDSQVPEGLDVLNVGGFSDTVFRVVAAFARGELGDAHAVAEVEAIAL